MQMRRIYNLSSYLDIVDNSKHRFPLFNFTTDIMVGFPGETEEDFEATCKVIREVGFSHVHTFKYSIRQGTRAARMDEQVPSKVKNNGAWSSGISLLKINSRYRKHFTGKQQTVLVENINEGIAKGYGENYVPVEFKIRNPRKITSSKSP